MHIEFEIGPRLSGVLTAFLNAVRQGNPPPAPGPTAEEDTTAEHLGSDPGVEINPPVTGGELLSDGGTDSAADRGELSSSASGSETDGLPNFSPEVAHIRLGYPFGTQCRARTKKERRCQYKRTDSIQRIGFCTQHKFSFAAYLPIWE